ncbi:MAG: glycosyltransferase, partial [bacterium]|nr:glycosyltransferase [bacterium]
MTMRNAEKCSIHVVTWNSHRHLPVLFRSIDIQDTSAFTVTVVDNASGDGTTEWLKQQRPDTVLLRNFRNLGFAKAHNQAITLALSRWNYENLESRYILITNPDLEFDESAIRLMMEYLDAHPDVS